MKLQTRSAAAAMEVQGVRACLAAALLPSPYRLTDPPKSPILIAARAEGDARKPDETRKEKTQKPLCPPLTAHFL